MRDLATEEVKAVCGGSGESSTFESVGLALEVDAGIAEATGVAADATIFGAPLGMFLGVGGLVMGGIGFFMMHRAP